MWMLIVFILPPDSKYLKFQNNAHIQSKQVPTASVLGGNVLTYPDRWYFQSVFFLFLFAFTFLKMCFWSYQRSHNSVHILKKHFDRKPNRVWMWTIWKIKNVNHLKYCKCWSNTTEALLYVSCHWVKSCRFFANNQPPTPFSILSPWNSATFYFY